MADLEQAPVRAPIVVVTEGGAHIWAIVNAIEAAFGPICVVVEQPESKRLLLSRRMRRQGIVSVAGQLGTMILIRLMKRLKPRVPAGIAADAGLDTTPPEPDRVIRVSSADSPELVAALRTLAPAVVLLAGCRLLSPPTLAAIEPPVLNYHAGIAPKYRGMNGGYWALATGDAENFGATVHLVDAGVDTGAVLYKVRARPHPDSTIATYALSQAASSRDIIVKSLADALDGRLRPFKPEPPSGLWFHPTIWRYLFTGLTRGVW